MTKFSDLADKAEALLPESGLIAYFGEAKLRMKLILTEAEVRRAIREAIARDWPNVDVETITFQAPAEPDPPYAARGDLTAEVEAIIRPPGSKA
ncbi:MAG: hypothetical protein ABL912_02030 [Novosphingobium sp.]